MPTITKERMEAWLFSQPDDRTYSYQNIRGCVVCMFIAETSNKTAQCGGGYWRDLTDKDWHRDDKQIVYPDWLINFERKFCQLSNLKEAKAAWLEMFPESKELLNHIETPILTPQPNL